MAVKLDTFPIRSTHSRYDWGTFLNGEVWKLSPGTDFNGKTATFVANARARAKRRGGRLRTQMLGEDVIIQFRREQP